MGNRRPGILRFLAKITHMAYLLSMHRVFMHEFALFSKGILIMKISLLRRIWAHWISVSINIIECMLTKSSFFVPVN